MKKLVLAALFTIISVVMLAQNNVGIGTNTPNANAKLDIASTTKGLLIPRMTTAQRITFAGTLGLTDEGMMVYDTDLQKFYYWDKNIGFSGDWNQVRPGSLSDGKIWIGDATNTAVERNMSGDVTMSDTGRTTIQPNAVQGTDISLTGETNGYVMQFNGTDWVPVDPNTLAVSNIYSADGSLTGNRIVTMGANNLNFTSSTGGFNITTSNGGMTMGNGSTAINTSAAFGANNTSSGGASFTTGTLNTASGSYSMAVGGQQNTASGYGSFATGVGNFASGGWGFVVGKQNYATAERSFASGEYTVASGLNSSVFGMQQGAYSFGEHVVGIWGTPYTPTSTSAYSATDRVFNVGNGSSSSAPSDAFTILKNGNTGIGISNPTNKLEVVGKTKTDSFQLTTGATNNYILRSDASGNGTWVNPSTLTVSNIYTADGSLTGNRTVTMAANNLNFNATNGDFIYNPSGTGKMGIGGTPTTYKLEVLGSDASLNGVRVGRGAGNIVDNTAVGNGALSSNTTGASNTAMGSGALSSNTSGSSNVANGFQTLFNNSGGFANSATGYSALYSNTTGSLNVANGYEALYDNTSGNNNIAIGSFALNANSSGSRNVAIGSISLFRNSTGNSNTAYGTGALSNNTSGDNNVAIGDSSLFVSSITNNNTAIGSAALRNSTTGTSNAATGFQALYGNTSGTQNVAIGSSSGSINTTGSNNTYLGYNANSGIGLTGLSNATAIGANTIVSASNSIVLGNNANVGIGASSPTTKLEVIGKTKTDSFQLTTGATNNYILKSDASGNGTWVNPNTLGVTNTLTNPVNTITSTVNGVSATAPAVNSVSNTSSANTMSTTINGVAGATVPIINTNTLTVSAGALTSTVNGVASSPAIDLNASLIKTDIVNASGGALSITNGTAQLVGATNATLDVLTNTQTQKGIVTAPGASANKDVWGTDATGNPAWRDATNMNNVQNGINLNTTAPNATATDPYIELGGSLVRPTTITTPTTNNLTITNSGTANTIINLSSTGDLDIQDNGTSALFVRDDANVGVGTNAPASKLHVNSTATATGDVFMMQTPSLLANNATYMKLGRNLANGNTADIVFHYVGDNNNDNRLGFGFFGTPMRMILTNDGRLAVKNGVADASSQFEVDATNKGVLIPRVALTGTTDAATIATPATSLLVYNTATAGTSPNNVVPGYYYNSGTTAAPVWRRMATGNSDAWTILGNSNTTSPALPATYGTTVIGAAENFLGSRNTVDLVLGTNNLERMRILSGATATTLYGSSVSGVAGYAGIGVPVPLYKLHVGDRTTDAGNSIMIGWPNRSGTIAGATVGQVMTRNTINFPGFRDFFGSSKIGASISSINKAGPTTGGYSYIGETQSTDLAFATASPSTSIGAEPTATEKMRLTDAGNLGIGTASPTNPLHIQHNFVGGGILNSGNGANAPGYILADNGTSRGVFGLSNGPGNYILGSVNGDICLRAEGATNSILFSTGGGTFTSRMAILSNGNVGIGTIAPNAALQFGNVLSNRRIVLWEGANNDHQYYGFGINGSTLRYQVDATTANHIFYAGASTTTSNELMRIQGNGNVGIGSAIPDNRLTVDAAAATAASTNTYPFAIRRAGTTELTMGSDATLTYLQSWNSRPLLINGQGNNVGIGLTTAPAYKLSVNGTIEAIDFGAAGSQNIRVGDDAFLTDLDLANTLGVRSTTSAFAHLTIGTTNAGLVSGGTENYVHGAGTQTFGTGGQYIFAASQSVTGNTFGETGGFYADGNAAAIWSPGDGNQAQPAALLYFMDEDFWDATNTNPYDNTALKSYINTAGALVTVSDSTKKQNIIPIRSALNKITSIGGYEYQFKLAPTEIQKGQKAVWSSGVLAQEVEKQIPTAVEKSADGDYFVNYSAIIPYLIEGMKEQQKIIDDLKKRLEAMEQK